MAEEKNKEITPAFDLVEKSIKEWWKNLLKFIGVYLWGLLYTIIPLVIILFFTLLDGFGNQQSGIAFIIIASLGGLVAAYFYIRTYMSLFILVKEDYKGKDYDIFKASKKMFWPYLGLVLMTTIFILLWSLLLIIPGIVFSIFYSLAVYVFFWENKKGMAAIKRSIRLVRGYWWPVFGRFVLIGVLIWVFTVIISIPLHEVEEGSTFFIIWNVVVQVVSLLVAPITLVYGYHIYKDLVKIKK